MNQVFVCLTVKRTRSRCIYALVDFGLGFVWELGGYSLVFRMENFFFFLVTELNRILKVESL